MIGSKEFFNTRIHLNLLWAPSVAVGQSLDSYNFFANSQNSNSGSSCRSQKAYFNLLNIYVA